MSTDLRAAFEDLAKTPYNLLSSNAVEELIASLRPRWVDYEANGRVFKSTEKSKAIVYRDNEAVTLSAVGVVDGDNSQLGDYGNLWLPRGGRNFTPELNDLAKARFVVNLTYPRGEDGKVDKVYADKASKQILALNEIQLGLNAALAKDSSLPSVESDKISDWIDFEESGGGVHGSAKITLGSVYSPASRKLRGSEVKELSPRKAAQPSSKPKCDSLGFFDGGRIPKSNTLQPVEELPVYLADGSSAKARDAEDLSTLLYTGRWIRVDFQMIIWNIKNAKGNSRAFKLEATRVSLLATKTGTVTNLKFLKPNSLNETDGDVPKGLIDGKDDSDTASDDDQKKEGPSGRTDADVDDPETQNEQSETKKRGGDDADLSEAERTRKKGKTE